MSAIEWTEKTWNPTVGCRRVSPGCKNCYAEKMAGRLVKMGQTTYEGLTTGTGARTRWTGLVRFLPERLALPFTWRKPSKIFVDSMSDLFHEDVSNEEIAAVLGVMACNPQHTFQLLTKRDDRLLPFYEWLDAQGGDPYTTILHAAAVQWRDDEAWEKRLEQAGLERAFGECEPWPLPNLHLGVSAENQEQADKRIPRLLAVPAALHWVSVEPMLEGVDLGPYLPHKFNQEPHCPWCEECIPQTPGQEWWKTTTEERHGPFLGWVVAGGESGLGARPMHPKGPRKLRDQCVKAGVPFMFKQWGAWAPRRLPWDADEEATAEPSGLPHWVEQGSHWAMIHTTKAKAGRLLDGAIWDQYPPAPPGV